MRRPLGVYSIMKMNKIMLDKIAMFISITIALYLLLVPAIYVAIIDKWDDELNRVRRRFRSYAYIDNNSIGEELDKNIEVLSINDDFQNLTDFYNNEYNASIYIDVTNIDIESCDVYRLITPIWKFININSPKINGYSRSGVVANIWFKDLERHQKYYFLVDAQKDSLILK